MNLSKIDKAHIIAAVGAVCTLVATIVPAWSSEMQAIVAALGGTVSILYPLVKVVEKLADSNVSAKDVEAGAVTAAKSEIAKVDFNKLAADAVAAQSIPDLEAKVRVEAQAAVSALLARLSAPDPAPAPVVPPAV